LDNEAGAKTTRCDKVKRNEVRDKEIRIIAIWDRDAAFAAKWIAATHDVRAHNVVNAHRCGSVCELVKDAGGSIDGNVVLALESNSPGARHSASRATPHRSTAPIRGSLRLCGSIAAGIGLLLRGHCCLGGRSSSSDNDGLRW